MIFLQILLKFEIKSLSYYNNYDGINWLLYRDYVI